MSSSVAVVMAAWNTEAFIAEALQSVLDQSVAPSAIVVVDDESTDGTVEIARAVDPGILVLEHAHQGIGASRTAGIAATESTWVAFLDADDVWLPHKLERQLSAASADPSIEAVFCCMDEFVDLSGGPLRGVREPNLGVAARLSSAALIRRTTIDRIGPFPTTVVADWVGWWTRARQLDVREVVVPEVLLRRRLHSQNNSARYADNGRRFLSIAREHLRSSRTSDGPA